MPANTPGLQVPQFPFWEGFYMQPMTVATPASAAQITGRRFNPDHLFYVVAAGVMLIFTAGGFRNFYLRGRAPWGRMTTQIMPLIVAHGARRCR
jgi:hypothetical protein